MRYWIYFGRNKEEKREERVREEKERGDPKK
jgi:hypothetical protein